MSKIDFLTDEQITGRYDRLDLFRKTGIQAEITDFSILLGGYVTPSRKGMWWTKSAQVNTDKPIGINEYSNNFYGEGNERSVGARPCISFNAVQNDIKNKKTSIYGVFEFEYGEYPQTIVEDSLQEILESEFKERTIATTGKRYTTDSRNIEDYNNGFSSRCHIEYEYRGKKYIRFVADKNSDGEELSNGKVIESGNPYWIKVEPIKWLYDETGVALSEKIIFAGVRFEKPNKYKGSFESTEMYRFLDNFFYREIMGAPVHKEETKNNQYAFDYSEVSEEDIIRGAIESDVPVFLHGKSGDGKSDRVKDLDPDCEIVYLRNASPESLNGKSVYNEKENEMIDVKPTWLKRLEERCEKEKDKIHILFFDELTNAPMSIQGMAFNIILSKEVNGKWRLPENVRIVAAGNEYSESMSSNGMSEPLFNRFAHVYIETKVEDWLKWASEPKEKGERLDYNKTGNEQKIHPAIYAFIAYKAYSKQDVLRTPYTGIKPNADPRKWEMSSRVLYRTKKPEMLRSLIGEELTKEFISFTERKVITIEDVLNNNYSSSDLEMNVSEKFNTIIGLSKVDVEHIEIVRNFVKKLGREICATFDTLWSQGKEERLEIILELKMKEDKTNRL